MDESLAEHLVAELKRQHPLMQPNESLFLNMLVSAEVPDSRRFYEDLPDTQQLIQESDCYHFLSLRRVLRNRNAEDYIRSVLRNRNAEDYRLSRWKRAYETIASALGFYSSDSLSRNLRADQAMVALMAECKEPFSLLGKLQTYDYSNADQVLFVITRPLLVIPGVNVRTFLDLWETENTTYEREVKLMGFAVGQRRTSKAAYLSQ